MNQPQYVPKLSKSLEDRLRKNKKLDMFLSDYKNICTRNEHVPANSKYAHCIHQLLELSNAFEKQNTKYVILGGLAVLAHAQDKNPLALLEWRGTEDVDLLADAEDIKVMLSGFGYRSEKALHNVRDGDGIEGRLYNFVDSNYGVSIGLREGVKIGKARITNGLYRDSQVIDFYGIPVKVPSIRHLISMKRAANRKKDRDDITYLKSLGLR